ncbi:hypothetical protein [Brevibacillus composti]|nr:hypothetical protein [Brevibacillus composti]
MFGSKAIGGAADSPPAGEFGAGMDDPGKQNFILMPRVMRN